MEKKKMRGSQYRLWSGLASNRMEKQELSRFSIAPPLSFQTVFYCFLSAPNMAAIVGSIISLGSICLFYDQTLSNYSRVDWDTKHELDTYSFSAIHAVFFAKYELR
jgi:hypothetical protein